MMQKENTQQKETGQEVTLIQALSEIYTFSPRKKRGAVICFEITFPGDDDKKEAILFGKRWDSVFHKWQYFQKEKQGLPTFACEEAHFVSNLFCYPAAREHMIYAAQQGKYKVTRYNAVRTA